MTASSFDARAHRSRNILSLVATEIAVYPKITNLKNVSALLPFPPEIW